MTTSTNGKGRFTPEQRKDILAEAKTSSVGATLKKHNISATTFYKWKNKASGKTIAKTPTNGTASELTRLRTQNRKLMFILVEQLLKGDTLERVLAH